MYSKILIPTDGSELAGKAVEHGVALAKAVAARIPILTVTRPYRPEYLIVTAEKAMEDPSAEYQARVKAEADERCASPRTRRRPPASRATPCKSRTIFPTRRSSIPRDRKAATLSSWLLVGATVSRRCCSAGKTTRCLPLQNSSSRSSLTKPGTDRGRTLLLAA